MTTIHCIHASTCMEPCISASTNVYDNCPYSLSSLNLSSVQEPIIYNSENLNIDEFPMGTRDEIVARLRQLPSVLDKTDGEIAETLGISASLWSNYKAEHTDVTIRPMVALELWNAYGIPMEWIYDGQSARTPDAQMRAKLATANRRAEVWLASRRPPEGRFARILTVALACSVVIGSCVGVGQAWTQTDGTSLKNREFNAARLACRGEARDHIEHQLAGDNEADYAAIYIGCMSELGYTPNGNWYKP